MKLPLLIAACVLAAGPLASAIAASEERYWLGPEFEGLPLTATPGASFIYGDCDPGPEGGCAPPLEVQNSSTCERNPVAFDIAPRVIRRLRGGAILADYRPDRVEINTGHRAVAVFADDGALAWRAASQLRPRSANTAPGRLAPPSYPRAVRAELRRVIAARRAVRTVRGIADRTGLSRAQARTRLLLARLVGRSELRGVPVPRRPWRAVERDRQVAFESYELGERRTARRRNISRAQLRRVVRRVRGLTGSCRP